MSISCSHGSFGEAPNIAPHGDCPDCRTARIEVLLARIADALERRNEREDYDSAIRAWERGQGKHPDD